MEQDSQDSQDSQDFFRWGCQNGLAFMNPSNPEPKPDTQAIITVVNVAVIPA